jgi:ribosome-associated toxin RatA of RatAB toxin-antitoxin module
MMRTVDYIRMRAPMERVFRAAADVEQWPALLGHYRWVRMLERRDDGGVVEMAAWRPFGLVRYPTWWVSEMWLDRQAPAVHYRHIRGITRGMNVVWRIESAGEETQVTIEHEWTGPRWPLVGSVAAKWIIGPVFIHGIASRTLAGIARFVEDAEDAEDAEGGPHPEGALATEGSEQRSSRTAGKVPRGACPERSRRARDDAFPSSPPSPPSPSSEDLQ